MTFDYLFWRKVRFFQYTPVSMHSEAKTKWNRLGDLCNGNLFSIVLDDGNLKTEVQTKLLNSWAVDCQAQLFLFMVEESEKNL